MKDEEGEYFETTSGVRQGGSESPNLYNLYMDYIMRVYEKEAQEQDLGISLKFRMNDQVRKRGDNDYHGMGVYCWLGYADDLVILSKTQENLQVAANLLSDIFSRFGLTISIDKTKTMIMNYKGDLYPESLLSINNNTIDNVKEFKYLGATVAYNEPGTSTSELNQRIGMAVGKFAQMKKILCNYHLKLPIRMRFYDVYVRSRLTYCCETWTLTQKQYAKIETTHVGFLRRMIRGGMSRRTPQKVINAARKASKNGDPSLLEGIDWSYRLRNNQIYHISKSMAMQDFIERQNIRWIGHICRAENNTLAKQLMFPDVRFTKRGYHHPTVYDNVIKGQISSGKSAESFLRECFNKKRN